MRVGAGRPAYRMKTASCPRINVRTLVDRLHIEKKRRPDYAEFSYLVGQSWRSQVVWLQYTPCYLGGERMWLRCPGCANRCAVMFLRAGRFACRKCQQLVYPSQSEDTLARSWRGQQKLEQRLGDEWERPKGMHHKTHERIVDRLQHYTQARENALALFIGQMMGIKGTGARNG
jgi:hypothetical protein